MKLAIFSDIHANLSAFEAVLNVIDDEKVDRLFCLGDIVGYGARPNECIDIIRDRKIVCVLGNHDAASVKRHSFANFKWYAREANEWTIKNLSETSRDFLLSLDYTSNFEDALFTHSSPHSPSKWYYLVSRADAIEAFQSFEQSVGFIGHTHVPVEFKSSEGTRKIINVGSVGQPRDGDSRACFVLYNTETGDYRWIRVGYNIDEAAQQILDAGLPSLLAKRLYSGK